MGGLVANQLDELKFVLTSIAPESKDAEFTWKEFQARVNNELADILGNFVNRAVVLTQKYFEGIVPKLNELTEVDQDVLAQLAGYPEKIEGLIRKYKLREGQSEAMNLARLGNKYLAETEPWKLAKTDMARVETILNIALQITANLTIAFAPFLPKKAQQIADLLNCGELGWDVFGSGSILPISHQINTEKPEILIAKVDDAFVEKQIAKLEASKVANTIAPKTPQKELLVDVGVDKRTIVSGIAEHFKPADVIGKKVCVLLNLAPRAIRGVTSEGMILMAENEEGKLSFVSPQDGFGAGSEVR